MVGSLSGAGSVRRAPERFYGLPVSFLGILVARGTA